MCAGVHVRSQERASILCATYFSTNKQSIEHIIPIPYSPWTSALVFWYVRPPLVEVDKKDERTTHIICRGQQTPSTNKTLRF